MAVIKIKRSSGISAPASLEHGELAVTIDTSNAATYNNNAGRLFVGNSDGTPVVIGGQYNAKLLDHEPGILTENSAIVVGAAGTIDNLNVIGIATIGQLGITTLTAQDVSATDVSVASSLTVGVSTIGENFYALSNGTVNVNSLIHSGINTDPIQYPVLYVNAENVVTSNTGFAWIDETQQLYVDNDVAVGRSSFALSGIFTTGRIENLIAGIGVSTYSFPTTRAVSAGQILVSDANGVLGFATNDQRLNFIANEFTGSVGLGSESLNILGGQNINTVATGAGLTVTINLTDDVLVGGALTVTGDFTVEGNITYLSSTITQIEDKKIELAVPEAPTSPTDATADGGGIAIKGDIDYEIVWSNSRDAFTVNQGWEPLGDNTLSLGSTTVQWKYIFGRNAIFENLNATGVSTFNDVVITGVSTFTTVDINGGTIDNAIIGAATSTVGNFTNLGFLTAFGENATIIDLSVTGVGTFANLAFTSSDRNGVAYAGTNGYVGFSSSPSAGISTSTYILTSLGIGTANIPVWTDTIDCGTY